MAAFVASMIVAQAFRYMKLAPPSSFDDDSDKARDADQMFPLALEATLEAGDWSFASRTVALPELVSLPSPHAVEKDLPYAYKVPGDFVAMQRVGDGCAAWRIDDGSLLRADAAGPLTIRYTRLIGNTDPVPANFRLAIAARLACFLGPVYLDSASGVEALENLAASLEKNALRADARSASEQRYDGAPVHGNWADEVTR